MAEFEGIANKSYSQISKEENKWRNVKKLKWRKNMVMNVHKGGELPSLEPEKLLKKNDVF